MPEYFEKIIGELQPAEFPSLPELLLRELELLEQGSLPAKSDRAGDDGQAALVDGDLFLTARQLANGADSTGRDTGALLRQCATRLAFSRLPASRLRFLKQLYLQSTLTHSLAEEIAAQVLPRTPDREQRIRQAGFCGLTLNIGALALEQVYGGRYLELLQQTADTQSLLDAERREFGVDHAELGAGLMRHWGAEGFSGDAVRYHHQAIGEILDATALVRISWLANQLADEKINPEAELWADTLFDLDAQALSDIQARANARLEATTRAFNIAFSSTRYLPLPETDEEDVLQREKTALRELRDRVEADSLFAPARARLAVARTTGDLGQAMGEAVQQLFGDYDCLLFARTDAGEYLQCIAGMPDRLATEPLSIRCLAERSTIADSCLRQKAVFRLPESGLTVIDRQVQSLLGTDNFCCEPCVDPASGDTRGILVTGVPLQRAEAYKKQKYLRTVLGRELGRYLAGARDQAGTQPGDVTAAYERRIRETIHEVNNPLGIIKNYLQLLSMKQEADPKVKSEISFIKSEIDRVSKILETLKQPPATNTQQALNLNAVVRSLVNMFQGSFAADEHIAVSVDLDPQLPEIVCSEDAIRQIITNLVKNAAEAFSAGGNIMISTAGNVYMDGNRYIQLCVKDDGPGIPAAILDNLFASGHSTKDGNHTGSGLAIVNNLVKNLRGQISCRTTPAFNGPNRDTASAAGTEFAVLFPVSRSSETPGKAQ